MITAIIAVLNFVNFVENASGFFYAKILPAIDCAER